MNPIAPQLVYMDRQLGPVAGQQRGVDGVPIIDTERQQLETVLQTARNFADARRADGRKSPTLLVAEEVFRLRAEANTLRGNYVFWLDVAERRLRENLSLLAELTWLKRPWWYRLRANIELWLVRVFA